MHNIYMTKSKKAVQNIHKIDEYELELLSRYDKEYIKIANSNQSIPDGFIVASHTHLQFLKENLLPQKINALLSTVHFERPDSVMQVSNHIKNLIKQSKLSEDLEPQIINQYKSLGSFLKKAKVSVGHNATKLTEENNLINEIKNLWAERFEPKELIYAHKNNVDHFANGSPIIIKKQIDFKTTGKLFTSVQSLESGYSLSENEKKQIKELGEKLKKQFKLPYDISWRINKGKR